jgi:TolA-binding protein
VALAQGEDALAHLGLGELGFEQTRWDVARREFGAARDAGSGAIATTAEYGLAATAFNQRQFDEFKRLAPPLLAGPSDPRTTPNLLYGQAAVAADEKRWTEAREMAVRLAGEYPRVPLAPSALSEVGAAAGADRQWPLAREMYEALAKRYPEHPGNVAGRLAFGEALLRTGAPADARRELEAFTKGSPIDAQMPRALLLLAEAQEALGNRAAAVELYARVDREFPGAKSDGSVPLKAARLLQTEGKWAEAKGMLERALSQSDPEAAPEVAYRLGEGLRATGQNEDAVEAYMTAAYLGPDSPWGRRALLGAGQSFAALRQPESAAIVYKKLMAASGVEPDLAAAARTRLKALGVN